MNFAEKTMSALLLFGKNSAVGIERADIINIDLTCSKHPTDVIKRRSKALVDNTCVVRAAYTPSF